MFLYDLLFFFFRLPTQINFSILMLSRSQTVLFISQNALAVLLGIIDKTTKIYLDSLISTYQFLDIIIYIYFRVHKLQTFCFFLLCQCHLWHLFYGLLKYKEIYPSIFLVSKILGSNFSNSTCLYSIKRFFFCLLFYLRVYLCHL